MLITITLEVVALPFRIRVTIIYMLGQIGRDGMQMTVLGMLKSSKNVARAWGVFRRARWVFRLGLLIVSAPARVLVFSNSLRLTGVSHIFPSSFYRASARAVIFSYRDCRVLTLGDREILNSLTRDLLQNAPLMRPAHRIAAISDLFELTLSEDLELMLIDTWEDLGFLGRINDAEFLHLKNRTMSALRRVGSYRTAGNLDIKLKMLLDTRKGRPPGLHSESAHFSAMGHLVLLHFLLLAVNVGVCKPSGINLVRGQYPIANQPYADWLNRRAKALGVSIIDSEHVYSVMEPDLSVWPSGEGYLDSHHHHGEILSLSRQSKLQVDDKLVEDIASGRKILESLGVDPAYPTVGFHIRADQAMDRSLRNSTPEKYFEAFDLLASKGYTVVLLGSFGIKGPSACPAGVVQVSKLKHERDRALANLATWHDCEFFVGNLSGGTNPPGAFGRPTLWVDQFPLSHWRVPGPLDLFLPQLVYSHSMKRALSVREVHSDSHRFSQTESPVLLERAGYSIRPVSAEEITLAVMEMMNLNLKSDFVPTPEQLFVDSVYREHGFGKGGVVAQSFLTAWGSFLR